MDFRILPERFCFMISINILVCYWFNLFLFSFRLRLNNGTVRRSSSRVTTGFNTMSLQYGCFLLSRCIRLIHWCLCFIYKENKKADKNNYHHYLFVNRTNHVHFNTTHTNRWTRTHKPEESRIILCWNMELKLLLCAPPAAPTGQTENEAPALLPSVRHQQSTSGPLPRPPSSHRCSFSPASAAPLAPRAVWLSWDVTVLVFSGSSSDGSLTSSLHRRSVPWPLGWSGRRAAT